MLRDNFQLRGALVVLMTTSCSGTLEDSGELTAVPRAADEATMSGDEPSGVGPRGDTDPMAPKNTTGEEQNEPAAQEPATGAETPSEEPSPDPTTPAGLATENPAIAPTEFECNAEVIPPSAPLRRLTTLQYRNSIRDLVARAIGDATESEQVLADLAPSLARVVIDERPKLSQDLHGSYRRLDQRVQQPHVDSWYELSTQAGAALTSPQHLTALLEPCEADATCVDDFIRSFGELAFRRPISSEEATHYRSFYAPSTGLDPAGFADVISGFLNSPQFLYLVEHGQEGSSSESAADLDAFELASRLSYHFWNTMPDSELFELARSGELLDEGVYRAQVDRLWSDSRTQQALSEFYREWLKVEDLPELDRNNAAPVFQQFAGANAPSSELRSAMQQEALELVAYHTAQSSGGLGALLQSEFSFARTEELASLYGIEPWSGTGTPPSVENRPGLFTRAAFLATGTANTRPIMRGLFIRTNILCDEVPPPPAAAGALPPELNDELTTREVVEQLTGVQPCAGCHEAFINPIGFSLENFDSLGRQRTEQRLYDADGDSTGSKPVDTSSIPQIVLGDTTPASGATDLMQLIVDSGKLEACFSRHYFRYTFSRWEGVNTDGCALEELRSSLETQSIGATLKEVALTNAFRSRSFDPNLEAEAL